MIQIKREFPRIVCLSHDSVDMLIQLGAHKMVVGRPAGEKRTEVAHADSVGGYGSIRTDKVRALKPDVVIAYETFQQRQTAPLVDAGLNVLTLGHRCFEEIFNSMRLLGVITDTGIQAQRVIGEIEARIAFFEQRNAQKQRTRVYFEEWDDPMVVAPRWVSEIIHLAGGIDVFARVSQNTEFEKRAIQVSDLIEKDPEVIVASWCGKPVKKTAITERPGIDKVDAVKNNRIFEVPGNQFLQPGPAILNGVDALYNLLHPDNQVSQHD